MHRCKHKERISRQSSCRSYSMHNVLNAIRTNISMNNFIKRFPGDSFIYFITALGFLILTVIVFLFPVGFSEYRNTDAFAPFWYIITVTGGVYSSAVIITALTVYLLTYFKKDSKKKNSVLLFAGTVLFFQILVSGSTLFYFKNVFRNQRPSQLYILERVTADKGSKEFISLPPEEKSMYLRKKVEENKTAYEDVYPPILNSWSDESGFSFPSGHSETSFFLGTIMTFVILKTAARKNYIILPVIWSVLVALSRVVIGVHFPSDVVAGAFIGLSIALILVSLKKVRAVFKYNNL